MVDKVVDKFDDLAISLSNGGSRRLIMRRLAASALGALGMMSLAEDEADANGAGIRPPTKKRKPKKPKRPKKCAPGRKRCGKRCCRKNQVCKQGKCRNKPKENPDTPGCTPISQDEACAGRVCGTVSNECSGEYTCGPNEGACTGTNEQCNADGQCDCVPLSRDEACGDRECGTVSTGCGSNEYTCGDGTCPVVACQTAVGCSAGGACIYETETLQGSICGAGGTGMCVDGACEATNPNGTCSAIGASGCVGPGEPGFVGYCNTAETCLCYTTAEGAGFCIDYPAGIGCQTQKPERVPCSSSTTCGTDEVCVNLNTPNPNAPGEYTGVNCCNGSTEVLGMCVALSAKCSNPN